VYLAGSALFAGIIKQAMKKDTRSFIQKMLLMVILILALMFRRVSGVVLPLVTVGNRRHIGKRKRPHTSSGCQ
jgi:predicted RND superfamily exporter protein